MRRVLVYFLALIVNCSFAQIDEIQINDSRIFRIIDLTIDTLDVPENELGVITIEISNFNVVESEIEVDDERVGKVLKKIETLVYDVKSSFNMNEIVLKYHPPACYFFYRHRPILIYFGVERFIKVGDKKVDDLRKKLKKYFRQDGGSYTSPTCWLKVNGDEVALLKRWTVRW